MATLASLRLMLGASSAEYRKELKAAGKSTVAFAKTVKNVKAATTRHLSQIGTAATAMTGATYLAVRQSMLAMDDLRRSASNVGVATEQFQAMNFAAKAAGLQTDEFTDVIKDLNAKVTDFALTGGGAMTDFFKKTGEDIRVWQALDPAAQFERFGQVLQNVSESEARFFLDEINDSAARLYDSLITTEGGFARNTQKAKAMGLVLSKEILAGASETAREMQTFEATLHSIYMQMMGNLAPVVSMVTRSLQGWVEQTAKAHGGFANLGKVLAQTFIQSIADASQALEDFINQAYQALLKLDAKTQSLGIDLVDTAKVDKDIAYVSERLDALKQLEEVTFADGSDVPTMQWTGTEEQYQSLVKLTQQYAQLKKSRNQLLDLSDVRASLNQAKADIDSYTVTLDTLDTKTKSIQAPTIAPPQTMFGAADIGAIKEKVNQAQQDIWFQDAMKNNGWSEQKAQLELQRKEYQEWQSRGLATKEQVRTLELAATQQYQAQLKALQDKERNEHNAFMAQQQASMEQLRIKATAASNPFEGEKAQENFDYQHQLNTLKLQYDQQKELQGLSQDEQLAMHFQFLEHKQALEEAHHAKLNSIQGRQTAATMGNYAQLFGQLSGVAETFAGKQSGIYKGMFLASKGFAIAESIVKIQQGIAGAAAMPFPSNIPAMLQVAAQTAGIVSSIQNTKMEGRRHGGPVKAGNAYEVNETGNPELLQVGNREILMMGKDDGHVTAHDNIPKKDTPQTVNHHNINVMFKVSALDTGGFDAWYRANRNKITNDLRNAINQPL